MTDELRGRLANFMSCFELVFDIDWEFTHSFLTSDMLKHYIAPGATFLNPGVDDESNNSHNRGALLQAYRSLASVMKKEGIDFKWNSSD